MKRVRNAVICGVGCACLISTVIPVNANVSVGTNAGVVSSLANTISNTAITANTAVVSNNASEDSTVSTGTTTTVCGYTNLGIASVDGNLNVRTSASEDSDLAGRMTNGAACEIVGTEGDWYQITSGDVSGYVKSEFILTGDSAVTAANGEISTIANVTTATLKVRQEPSTDSKVIYLVSEGEKLQVVEDQGDWVKVTIDDEEVYVSSQYVSLSTELPTAMTMSEVKYGEGVSDVRVDLVNYALQFVGNPYVWGGTSLTNGADCSGFVLSIYAKYGVSLPHSSKAQAGYGTSVSASEAKPGDLFFYGSGSSISHVAIYIGNGQIVHASSKKTGIKVSNAFYRTPICIRSLLN